MWRTFVYTSVRLGRSVFLLFEVCRKQELDFGV